MAIPGYKILRKLGDGGMSSVYMAIQLSVGREVALKVLAPELRDDPEQGQKFFREANISGTLSHPNIVSIYDVGNQGQFYYIAMDYLPGPSCAEKIKQARPRPREALRIIRDVACALDYVHSKGYAHCDVKPDNILFRHDGSAVLTDFGIALKIDTTHQRSGGLVAGTPYYMSPEQFQGKGLDGRADIYSLGIVLYELLTGDVPFHGKDAVSVAVKHISSPLPDLKGDLAIYKPILAKMLAKRASSRFNSGKEVMEAIDALVKELSSPKSARTAVAIDTGAMSNALSFMEKWRATTTTIAHIAWQRWVDNLRHMQISLRHGVVIRTPSRLVSTDLSGPESEIQKAIATAIQTREFHKDLGLALKSNQARLVISPRMLLALTASVLISIAGAVIMASKPEWLSASDFLLEEATNEEILEYVDEESLNESLREANDFYALNVYTLPAGASVSIRNTKVEFRNGIRLPAGPYLLSIQKPGYIPMLRWVELSHGDLVLNVTLTPTHP